MTTKQEQKTVESRVVQFHAYALSNALAKEAEKYLKAQIGLTDEEKALILLFGTKRVSDDLWEHHTRMVKQAEAGEAQ